MDKCLINDALRINYLLMAWAAEKSSMVATKGDSAGSCHTFQEVCIASPMYLCPNNSQNELGF